MSLLLGKLHRKKGRAVVNDSEIRRAYHRIRLARHHQDPNTLVVDELGLRHGAPRADIAVVNGHLLGIEIKSDADTLSRLGSQVDCYSAVFDRAVLVTATRRLFDAVREAIGSIGQAQVRVTTRRAGSRWWSRRLTPAPATSARAPASLRRRRAARPSGGAEFAMEGGRRTVYRRLP